MTVPSVTIAGKTSDFAVVGHELGTARWRVPPDENVPQESHVRHLEGELHLRMDLQPSCICQIFYIEVSGFDISTRTLQNPFLTVFCRNDGTPGRLFHTQVPSELAWKNPWWPICHFFSPSRNHDSS